MKILLLDIETSPNTAHVWGLHKQHVSVKQLTDSSYTLCWAAKWYKKGRVMFDSIPKSGHTEMIKRVHALIDEADAIIHYNGSKFDMPTLNKEFLLLGMGPPSPYKQIDLLKTTRKQFRFPSNKLDYIAQALGLSGKVKHEGHELWTKCMEGDPAAWRKMEKYNKQDVLLLEDVYDRLLPWIDGHPNWGLYVDEEDPTCPNCGSTHLTKEGFRKTTTEIYQRYHCQDCGRWPRGRRSVVAPANKTHILV